MDNLVLSLIEKSGISMNKISAVQIAYIKESCIRYLQQEKNSCLMVMVIASLIIVSYIIILVTINKIAKKKNYSFTDTVDDSFLFSALLFIGGVATVFSVVFLVANISAYIHMCNYPDDILIEHIEGVLKSLIK